MNVSAIPEPSTWAMMGVAGFGLIGLALACVSVSASASVRCPTEPPLSKMAAGRGGRSHRWLPRQDERIKNQNEEKLFFATALCALAAPAYAGTCGGVTGV